MKKILITLLFLLSASWQGLATDNHLREAAGKTAKDLAVRFDFDQDACFPDAAIFRNGNQNPGIEIDTNGCLLTPGWPCVTDGCRGVNSDLNDSNTYHRSVCVDQDTHKYCVHMYALYFEKDQCPNPQNIPGFPKCGHKHDIEYALVWTVDGEITHGSYSAHGNVCTNSLGSLHHDGIHIQIVYHKDDVKTHAFRFANSGDISEGAENPNEWYTPTIVDWYEMKGDGNLINFELRRRANYDYNYGDAGFHANDHNFLNEITKAIPHGYPDCDCGSYDCDCDNYDGCNRDCEPHFESFCWNSDHSMPTPTWDAAFRADRVNRENKIHFIIFNREVDTYLNIENGNLDTGVAVDVWHSAQWMLEPVAGEMEYYRIRHRWQDKYLHIEYGRLEVGTIHSDWVSAQWKLEPVIDNGNTYYRVRNRWLNSGDMYLHIESGSLEAGEIDETWWSAQWTLEPMYCRIKNPWQDKYVHIEYGAPKAGEIHYTWLSAQWILEPANTVDGTTYYRIRNRWQNPGDPGIKYLHIENHLHDENSPVEIGEIHDTWHSAQWTLEPVSGNGRMYFIRNRFGDNKYLHTENGTLKAGNTRDASAQWKLEAAAFSVERDLAPPDIDSLVARPDRLWPPNHRMVNVELEVAASDLYDPSPYCRITDVMSSEAVNGMGHGDRSTDWLVTGELSLDLRAERFGHGVGRIYTVEVTCSDYSGNEATEVVIVHVPHDQSTKLIFYSGFEGGDSGHWSTTKP
jgi:hypothetical protein